MKRVVVLLALLFAVPAHAHVGSPDVFFEGKAGPYKLYVTVRVPPVIPGVATIEVRASDPDVTGITVVPMRLSGPGSELVPTPDRASHHDGMFTAELWLMEHGALQVKVGVEGARGPATLSVPITANALRTMKMDKTLGAILFALMLLLAVSFISIAGAAVREAALDPGVLPSASSRKRTRIAILVATVLVVAALVIGRLWWMAEAREHESWIFRPPHFKISRDGCTLTLPKLDELMPDHGHEMHVFLVRTPQFDQLAHLHPGRSEDRKFVQQLPSLAAGHYQMFADFVWEGGFPVTALAEIDLPDLQCAPLAGDDAVWNGERSTIVFDPPTDLRAGQPATLHFRAHDVEPYMGMAGHAVVIRTDLSVYAHLHPSGTAAMPALMLAGTNTMTHAPHLPDDVTFPYGFPSPGAYKVFVQIKRAGHVDTAAFDVTVR